MKYIYRLKNPKNNYIWGAFATADLAFDAIEADPDYRRHGGIAVVREQQD